MFRNKYVISVSNFPIKASRINLIKLIAHSCPTSCTVQDEDGKTPLHFACDTSCELFEDDLPSQQQRVVDHETIRALLSASLDAATIMANVSFCTTNICAILIASIATSH